MLLLTLGCVRHGLYEERLARLTDDDGDGWTEEQGDCNDLDAQQHPEAEELCDGKDQDCDGEIDEDAATSLWYPDVDGDGFGLSEGQQASCTPLEGYATQGEDCDDANAAVNPGAQELCATEGVDDDCDGQVDEASAQDSSAWYADADGDGYGEDPAEEGCEAPQSGWVQASGDCDGSDDAVHPGADEVWYDGVDQDCDGASDHDADGDSFDLGKDCDDTDPAVHPEAEEVWYDGVDQDCDGGSDHDADGDGHDRVSEGLDCDDSDPAVNPDQEEICGDGIDQDCDGGPGSCGLPTLGDSSSSLLSNTLGFEAGTWLGVGDLDGDGILEVVAGAPRLKSSGFTLGGFVILDDGLQQIGSLTGELSDGTTMGDMASIAGDIDGDGDDDLLVGHAGFVPYNGYARGKAYFEFGPLTGSNSSYYPDASYKGANDDDDLGTFVLITPDLDNDGDEDFILSAPGSNKGGTDSGSVYVFNRTPSGETTVKSWRSELRGASSYDELGSALVVLDHDGNGKPDLVVVAPSTNAGGTAYLVNDIGSYEDNEDVDDIADLSWDAHTDGWALHLASGDVNGDGYEDLVVSDSSDNNDRGAIWVHHGPLSSLDSSLAAATLTGRSTHKDLCGAGLVLADYDGDGLDDLSTWCPAYSDSGAKGAVATWYGAGLVDGDVEAADSLILGGGNEALGTGMGAGDIDGDGYDDLLLGAPEADSVYLFYGGQGL